jgi:hypothetical protein
MIQQLLNWPPYLFAGNYIFLHSAKSTILFLETSIVPKNSCLLDVDYHSFMYKGCNCALDRNVPSASACSTIWLYCYAFFRILLQSLYLDVSVIFLFLCSSRVSLRSSSLPCGYLPKFDFCSTTSISDSLGLTVMCHWIGLPGLYRFRIKSEPV